MVHNFVADGRNDVLNVFLRFTIMWSNGRPTRLEFELPGMYWEVLAVDNNRNGGLGTGIWVPGRIIASKIVRITQQGLSGSGRQVMSD